MIEFILNNQFISVDLPPTTVLLDYIRRESKLTGTKEGCREGDCGACTVLIGSLHNSKVIYKSVNSCLVPLGSIKAKHIVTIEGLTPISIHPDELSSLQEAMVEEGGTQCGFCTPGFVVSMTNYFINEPKPNIESAIYSLGGNICRCTGYAGIIRAVEKSIEIFDRTKKQNSHLKRIIESKFVPQYFFEIPKRLAQITNQRAKTKSKYLISGGTDLYVQRWEELVQIESEFVSDKNINSEINIVNNRIVFGGACTIQQVMESKIINKYFPALQKQLELFGSLHIRNKATIAGNIVNASPIGDMTNILLSLDANIHIKGKKKRTIPLKKFYLGYKTLAKKKEEIVDFISINIPPKKYYFNYEKVSKRTYLDIASVNSSIFLVLKKGKIDSVNISAGGVAPIPLMLKKTSHFLIGKEITTKLVKDCADTAMQEISPISDARGTAEYKSLLLRQFVFAHFLKLFPENVFVEELI